MTLLALRLHASLPASLPALGLAVAGLLWSSSASATEAYDFVSVGLLFSSSSHPQPAPRGLGLGGEVTYVHYVDRERMVGVGAFLQGQHAGAGHARFALGPQLNYGFLGLELGGYAETSASGYASTWGAHAGPFLSLGILSAAFRVGVPLGTSGPGESYGTELGVAVTLKFPAPIGGDYLGNMLR
jgi:hypothetical protein